MNTLLHIDASARPGRSDLDSHGSHTRRLSARFAERWRGARPGDRVDYLDVGSHPPSPVTGKWVHAAFTPPAAREPWMQEALAESDHLLDSLIAADLIVVGLPMYNFGVPAQFKAYIDNIVRVGRTFGFDRARGEVPYWPMLAPGKRLVLLSARGDFGYGRGQRIGHLNHVEASVRSVFGYIGIDDVHEIAVEYDEFGGERLAQSLAQAERAVDHLVDQLSTADGASARITPASAPLSMPQNG
ncbi:FMN-dependent NADH-azoreductase 1 [Variovorax sp. PBS-H4]|uniref:FMN-dependent NADH-azoreductase n=1 Tax=Variovorax sp. PBS-H4 TaxID=434008 RepID=UPI0013183DFA|nr:NAD(P)H-dependent oxidoreductase [Variovorax sp. PBS-H4]VTU32882.1 FMN-dependent NADH-azoreductase 1 [Variovorax sp. PBS-H4]